MVCKWGARSRTQRGCDRKMISCRIYNGLFKNLNIIEFFQLLIVAQVKPIFSLQYRIPRTALWESMSISFIWETLPDGMHVQWKWLSSRTWLLQYKSRYVMFDILHMSYYSFSSFIELKLNSTDILLVRYRYYFFFLERNGLYTVDILRKIILVNNDKRTKKKTHVNQSTSAGTDLGKFRDFII